MLKWPPKNRKNKLIWKGSTGKLSFLKASWLQNFITEIKHTFCKNYRQEKSLDDSTPNILDPQKELFSQGIEERYLFQFSFNFGCSWHKTLFSEASLFDKPKMSRNSLILMALKSSKDNKLTFDQIKDFIIQKYPSFQNEDKVNWLQKVNSL